MTAVLLILLAAVIPVAVEWARRTHTQPADTDPPRRRT